ncbi:hypothetical protein ACJMK2_031550, partial [Sinanodonta woodiana]
GKFSKNDEELNRVRKVKYYANGDLDEISKRYEEKLQMYSRKVEQLEKEKNDLQIRLSSYDAARMTNENPYITDLDDPNRPTTISERYSELYDNHWTDAFVKLQDKHHLAENEAIDFLLDVLYVSFVECKQVRLQRERAVQALNQYIGADGDDQDLTVLEVMKTIKYAKRTNIKRMQKVFKESVEKKLLKKMKYEQMLHDIRPYLDECVEVCLLMNIQEPPLELRGVISSGSPHFDVSAFRSYTKSGKKMYYVVWPALHLCYDGPLVCKGIAQGMPEPSEAHKTKKGKVKDRQTEHN